MILLPTITFFVIVVILQIADGWTTYTLHKIARESRNLRFKEWNPILRTLMKWVGVEEALWIAKLGAIIWLWFDPVLTANGQWFSIAVYLVFVANNYRQVRKFKKS